MLIYSNTTLTLTMILIGRPRIYYRGGWRRCLIRESLQLTWLSSFVLNQPGPPNMERERLLLTPPGLINTPNFDGKLTEDRIENLGSYDGKRRKRTWTRWISYVSIGASTLALGFAFGRLVVREQNDELRATASPIANATTCASTPTRREWRSMSVAERDNYIDAVLCLKAKPSRLGMSNSLYDDFPYIHNITSLMGTVSCTANTNPKV